MRSPRSTDLFEGAREKIVRFLDAPSKDDIVFLRGTTEAINLVANSYGRANIGPGDEIIVSTIEHHANIVPWQLLREETGAVLRVIPVNYRGEIIFQEYAGSANFVSSSNGLVHYGRPEAAILLCSGHYPKLPVLLKR